MKTGANVVIGAAARLYAPLIALFALMLFSERPPGSGVGFVAGLAFGLVLTLHALVFGAAAARTALAPAVARLLLALGVLGVAAGAGLPGLRYAPQLIETGVFGATIAAAALVIQVTFGRAPSLRDAEL